MSKNELSGFSDQELLAEQKKLKSFSMTNAFLIGFLMGIVIFSIIKSTFGFLMLIPLYIAHKLINDPKAERNRAINEMIKQRQID